MRCGRDPFDAWGPPWSKTARIKWERWPTHSMMSRKPCSPSCPRRISRIARSPIGMSGFGRTEVYGARRVPRPPARITALVRSGRRSYTGERSAMALLRGGEDLFFRRHRYRGLSLELRLADAASERQATCLPIDRDLPDEADDDSCPDQDLQVQEQRSPTCIEAGDPDLPWEEAVGGGIVGI